MTLTLGSKLLFGCQCAEKLSICDEYESSEQVFIGQVVETNAPNAIYGIGGGYIYFFTIEVMEVFKGKLYKKRPEYFYFHNFDSNPTLDTNGFYNYRTFLHRDDGSCDFWFEKGKKYLIYSSEFGDFLNSSTCTRTRLLSEIPHSEIQELKLLKQSEGKKINNKDIIKIYPTENAEFNLTKQILIKAQRENKILRFCILPITFLVSLILIIKIIKGKKKTPANST